MCRGILNRPESDNPGTNQQFPYLIGIKLYLCVRQSSIESMIQTVLLCNSKTRSSVKAEICHFHYYAITWSV